MTEISAKKFIENLANEMGLEFFGAVKVGPEKDFRYFERWINQNKHADMKFLENYVELREDPSLLISNAKTALVFGMPYYQGYKHSVKFYDTPKVAQYAKLKDYHKLLKKFLEEISRRLMEQYNSELTYKVAVDSVPILERALAAKTRLGFIGKNTCYIHPQKGSFFLLGRNYYR